MIDFGSPIKKKQSPLNAMSSVKKMLTEKLKKERKDSADKSEWV